MLGEFQRIAESDDLHIAPIREDVELEAPGMVEWQFAIRLDAAPTLRVGLALTCLSYADADCEQPIDEFSEIEFDVVSDTAGTFLARQLSPNPCGQQPQAGRSPCPEEVPLEIRFVATSRALALPAPIQPSALEPPEAPGV